MAREDKLNKNIHETTKTLIRSCCITFNLFYIVQSNNSHIYNSINVYDLARLITL